MIAPRGVPETNSRSVLSALERTLETNTGIGQAREKTIFKVDPRFGVSTRGPIFDNIISALERVRTEARRFENRAHHFIIELAPTVHRIKESITLLPSLGLKANHRLTIRGTSSNNKPHVTSNVSLRAKQAILDSQTFTYDLPETLQTNRVSHLLVGGEILLPVRYPESSPIPVSHWDLSDRSIVLQGHHPAIDLSGRVYLNLNKHWTQGKYKISHIRRSYENSEPVTKVFLDKAAEDFLFGYMQRDYFSDGGHAYFENSKSFLNSAQTGFLFDAENREILLKRRDHHRSSNPIVEIATLETLLKIDGVDNVTVENIKFGPTLGNLDSDIQGIEVGQGGAKYRPRPGEMPSPGRHVYEAHSATIDVRQANEFKFRNLHVFGSGALGLLIREGSKRGAITCNLFDHIGSTAISVGDQFMRLNPSHEESIENVLIEDNLIQDVGKIFTPAVGILLGVVSDTSVRHNAIRNGSYSGISLGWGWSSQTAPYIKNNLIEYNEVRDVLNKHDDGGGIYTLSAQSNTLIQYNWLHEIKRSEFADNFDIALLYFDEQSSGITARRNLFENNSVDLNIKTHKANLSLLDISLSSPGDYLKWLAGPRSWRCNSEF